MDFQLKSVLISDDVDQQCVDILASSGIRVVKNTKLTKDQLKAEIAKYDGLIVRSATKVTADVIAAGAGGGGRLKLIGRAGTGVDNVDVAAATEHGVIVMNTPGGNTMSAVEHTCAMLMAISRYVSRGTACVRAGQWSEKKHLVGTELYGKTLAVIGLGRIGKEVAFRMQAFGMTTVGYDPIIGGAESREFGVEWMSLDELWPHADYITLHTPLIAKTKHMINSETLARCKRGVRIVNCARGGVIDEQALLQALESGQCAAAGLDVFEQEPPTNTALLQHPMVTSTPHLGASTVDAQTRVAVEIAQQFVAFTRQTALTGAINGQAVAMTMDEENKPWIDLAAALGKLVLNIVGENVLQKASINIVTRGECVERMKDSLSVAVLTQLVGSPSRGNRINLVNAAAFAKSKGILANSVHVSVPAAGRHCSTVMVEVRPADRARSKTTVEGTVLDGVPQWVAVDGVEFCRPIRAQGHLLLCRAAVASCTPQQIADTLRDVIDDAKAPGASYNYSLVSTQQASGADVGGCCGSGIDVRSWCVAVLSSPVGAVTAPPSHCDLLKSVHF